MPAHPSTRLLSLHLATLLASSGLQAATDNRARTLPSEADLFSAVPIVISASRLSQRTHETPVAVTVIDRETIEASGALEIAELLRLVPGFQVGMTTGNLTTVTAHGTGTPWFSRLQVLVDGRSAYHTTFSGLDWTQLGVALPDIERIEVIRGPNIAAYGANAIQGTINIVTRHPIQVRGNFLQATVGEDGRRDLVARHAGSRGDLDYRLTLQHREDDGFDDRLDSTDLNAISFRGLYQPSASDELDLQLEAASSELGDDLLPGTFPADTRGVDSNALFLRWIHSPDKNHSWQFQFNRAAYDSDEDARLLVSDWFGVAPGAVPLITGQPDQLFSYNQFETDSLTHDIELEYTRIVNEKLRLSLGTGYRWEEVQHFLTDSERRFTANSKRAFTAAEWRPTPAWVFTLNGLLEKNTLGGTSLSPRLGANYRLSNGHTLRAAATRGHKHPSLLEENWNALMRLDDGTPITQWAKSDGDLDTERRTVLELGYLGSILDSQLQFDTRVYHEQVRDAVIYARDATCPQPPGIVFPFCYRVGNYLEYDVKGAELGLSYRPTTRDFIRLSYAYADVDGNVPYSLKPRILQNLEHTAPRHSGSLLLSHRFGHDWQLSAVFYAAKDTSWYIDGDFIDEYLRLDLRLAKTLQMGPGNARVELIAQGLGDRHHEFDLNNRFGPGVYLRAGLDLD